MATITKFEVFHISTPGDGKWPTHGGEETVLVRLTDEDGNTGIGDTADPAGPIRAMLDLPTTNWWSRHYGDVLVGADPIEAGALWDRLFEARFYAGRRGIGMHALSAIDIALHDLAGKQVGRPVYKLLGGARRERVTPYATIYPGTTEQASVGRLMQEIERQFDVALADGFRAVKMELPFGDAVSDRELVGLIRDGRRMIGDDTVLLLDCLYRWRDWRDALWVLERVADCDVFLAEAALWHEDLASHAKLAARSPIRVGGAEFATTRWEAAEWIETGRVDVIQCSVMTAGGFTEMRRIADLCDRHGVIMVPMAWGSGILSMCGLHMLAALPAMPYVEYRPVTIFDTDLRRDLVSPAQPPLENGSMALPEGPGLGLTLNEDFLARHAVRLP